MKNKHCIYCPNLSEREVDDSFFAEYGSESKTHKMIYKIEWCNLSNCQAPENMLDCPILDNVILPDVCKDCSNIQDCIIAILDNGIEGLKDCDMVNI